MAPGNPLRIASAHAIAGRTSEAIACLEHELARTRSGMERPANVPLLAKTAGLYCEQTGALPQAARYYEEAVAAEEAAGQLEPLTLAALADIHWRMGQTDRAASCLESAETMARASSDADTLAVAANMRARWTGGR